MGQTDTETQDNPLELDDAPTNWDHRDREVLDVLAHENPDTVSLAQFRRLYRQCTDVRREDTMRDRIQHLTTEGPFEYDGHQSWAYTDGE